MIRWLKGHLKRHLFVMSFMAGLIHSWGRYCCKL